MARKPFDIKEAKDKIEKALDEIHKKLDSIKKYESIVIFKPFLNENIIQEYVLKIKALNIEIINQNNIGIKNLVYQLGEFSTGYYLSFDIICSKEEIGKLDDFYRKQDDILKFLTISADF